MAIKDVLDYVMETPHNTNRAVLKGLLEEIGRDTPVGPTEEWRIAGIYYVYSPGMSNPKTFTMSFETTPKKIRMTGFSTTGTTPGENAVEFIQLDGSDTKEITEETQCYDFSTGDGGGSITFGDTVVFRHTNGNDNYLFIIEYV